MGRAAVPLGELGRGRGEREAQLLEAARHAHGPALVPEVPLDLADHGGRGIGGELHAPVRVEPVHGLDQADRGDLGQVVQRLPAVAEPPGQVLHQGQVHPHQVVAQLRALRRTVRERAQPDEQGPRPAAVVRPLLPLLVLLLIHVVRPLRSVTRLVRLQSCRAPRLVSSGLLRDGRGTHFPRRCSTHGAPSSVTAARGRRRASCAG
ncbi:hypothetical protein GCM10020221_24000 [Streptomyces thioluteus]|uniref:Uncharacterized protein n=1 Tax=Streptomyces thioluteus TaxID=66431 RepID=A0ABP6JDG8_STRTU